jgi:nucleotide-binding universal stress UspA family protein
MLKEPDPEERRAELRRFMGAAAEAASVEILTEMADPQTEILRQAIDRNVDLIVMGTHGRSGPQQFLLGSVTGCVTAAPCGGRSAPRDRRSCDLRRLRGLVPAQARMCCRLATRASEGRPARTILRVADDEHADLIVMGVQGRGTLDLTLFGSNTHAVIRGAHGPVLIVPKRRSA